MSLDDALRSGLQAAVDEPTTDAGLADARARGRRLAQRRRVARAGTVVAVALALLVAGVGVRSSRPADRVVRTGDASEPGVHRARFEPAPRVDLFRDGVLGRDQFFATSVTAADDGVWAVGSPSIEGADRSVASIVHVASHGEVTAYLIEPASPTDSTRVHEVIRGPDGRPWFIAATGAGSAIGTVDAGGVVRLFTEGLGPWRPVRLTAGRDGALWFYEVVYAERDADPAIDRTGRARITTDGQIVHLASTERLGIGDYQELPDPASNVDPDDRSWPFADPSLDHPRPSTIVSRPAPDGGTWALLSPSGGGCCEGYERPFVRHTAADGTRADFHFDELDMLSGGMGYGLGSKGFAVAPDGAVWLAFAGYAGGDPWEHATIGRLTPDGTFHELEVTRGVSSLAVDAGGDVWFTVLPPRDEPWAGTSPIGRVSMGGTAAGGLVSPTIPAGPDGCVALPRTVGTASVPPFPDQAVLGAAICVDGQPPR